MQIGRDSLPDTLQLGQALLAAPPQGLFGPLALGHVADDAGEEPPVMLREFTERDLQREFAAVLAHTDHGDRFPGSGALSGLQVTRERQVLAVAEPRRHQDGEIATDQLLPRVAEAAFRCPIHKDDAPDVVDGDDGVRCGFGQGTEPILALAQGFDPLVTGARERRDRGKDNGGAGGQEPPPQPDRGKNAKSTDAGDALMVPSVVTARTRNRYRPGERLAKSTLRCSRGPLHSELPPSSMY